MEIYGGARLLALAFVAAALALMVASSSALAAAYTLSLSAPSSGTVGTVMAVTASGTDPTDGFAEWLDVDAIPTTLTSTCPVGYLNAGQLAAASPGGASIAFIQRENYDSSGNFSNVNAWTPTVAGTFLLCAYTEDGATNTLASASTTVTISAATAQVTAPVNTTRPRVTRSGGTLSCNAGVWTNAPVSYSYQWLVGSKVKKGAHGSTLRSAHKLRGRRVRCTVTASNSAGSASATSPAFKVH